MQINYTTFFVALLGIGTIVFIGIIGAAWMSAVDQYDPFRPTSPLHATFKHDPNINETYLSDATTSQPKSEDNFFTGTNSIQPSIQSDITSKDIELATKKQNDPRKQSSTDNTLVVSNNEAKNTEIPHSVVYFDSNYGECPTFTLTEEKGDLKPDYNDVDNCTAWIVKYEEGYNVDITIRKLELDRTTNDFLLISSGPDITEDEGNPILTGRLNETKQYRIQKTGMAYILFVTYKSNKSSYLKPDGFNIRYRRQGELTTPSPSTTPSSVPQPPDNNNDTIVVTILCKDCETLQQSNGSYKIIMAPRIEEAFKEVMANETNKFCDKEGIILYDTVMKENVFIYSKWPCVQTWPEHDKCIHMKIAIAINHTNSHYELTKSNLWKLWNEWNGQELKGQNLEKLEAPLFKTYTLVWTLSLIVFFLLLTVGVFYLWQFYLNCTYKRKGKEEFSEPSTSLDVPPFFSNMDEQMDDPEYLPAYTRFSVGTETSTDDLTVSYDKLPFNESPYNTLSFTPRRVLSKGIDNKVFFQEEEEDEYEIMSRNKTVNVLDKSQA